MFNYPIEWNQKTNSYELVEESGDMVSLQLRESEYAAIRLAAEIYESIGAKPAAEAMDRISKKVQNLLPLLIGSDRSEMAPPISLVRGPAPAEPMPWVDPLAKAISDQYTVRIRYYTLYRDTESERLVDPYRIVSREGRGYLVGFCHTRGRVIIFRLDRIRELDTTSDVFLIDADFKLEEFLGPMFGMFTDQGSFCVKIRSSQFVATWIREEVWHPTQSMVDLPHGSVQLDMTVTGLTAVKKWVLGFGSDAEVIEPPHLRREVEYEVEKLAAMYGVGS